MRYVVLDTARNFSERWEVSKYRAKSTWMVRCLWLGFRRHRKLVATKARANSGTRRPDEASQSPASKNAYTRLAAAVLAKATREARAGNLDATFWLLSEQAEFLADSVGLSWPHVQKWVREKLQLNTRQE